MSYILVRLSSGVVRLVEKFRIKGTKNKYGQKSTEISYGVMNKSDFYNLKDILMLERNQELRLLLAQKLISKYEYMKDMVRGETKSLKKVEVPEITKDKQKYIKKTPEELKIIEDRKEAFSILKNKFLKGEISIDELTKEYNIYIKKITLEKIIKSDKKSREKVFKSIDFSFMDFTDTELIDSIKKEYTKHLKSEKSRLRRVDYLRLKDEKVKEYEKFKSKGFDLKSVSYDNAKKFLNNKIYWLDDKIKNEEHIIIVTNKMGGNKSIIKESKRNIEFYNELKSIVNKNIDINEKLEVLRLQKVLL